MAVQFADEARIFIKAGDGGRGCVAYQSIKGDPQKRRPMGGMGGNGGNVIVIGETNLSTLMDFKLHQHHRAANGEPGGSNNRYGKNAADLIIRVPLGTLITAESGEQFEITEPDLPILICSGGKGGRGNFGLRHSAVEVNHLGEIIAGQWYELELKLMADLGIVGFPNAGKSSLVRKLSNAKPKVAAYPFTTLYPTLGKVRLEDGQSFTIADIPGLIEGAHRGVGLGNRFLRHISRVRALVFMCDLSNEGQCWQNEDGKTIADKVRANYVTLRTELACHDPALLKRPHLVLLNKIDLLTEASTLRNLLAELKDLADNVMAISVNQGLGLTEAAMAMNDLLVANQVT